MASNPDLVLGLVTHSRSRFRESGEHTARTVVEALQDAGIRCEFVISDRNDADLMQHRIDRSAIVRSARHQATLEARWRRHLDNRWGGRVGNAALTIAMSARRSCAAPNDLIRLLNIDLSHLRIWRAALARGAKVSLVLEDDAHLLTPDIGGILADLIPRMASNRVFVNCSASIDHDALGVQEILGDAPVVSVSSSHVLRIPVRAITNTVCANLYSAEFLTELVSFIDHRGLVPVVPIDWRVNAFLLENPDAGTWWLDPPPFQQGSMHL